jgi:large subunit ribosomal protein L21
MYAIVEVGKKQFKVVENDIIEAPLLDMPEGAAYQLKDVLLFVGKDGAIQVGTPTVPNVTIDTKVLGMVKGVKLIVFKKKKRKGYKRKRGHRQRYTRLLIQKINA